MPRIPTITKNLLIINILAFVGTLATRQQGSVDLNDLFGLHFFMASDFHVFQLVSYMFMHAGWEHLIFNMFMLWMFGTVVEHTWGSRRFIFYYIFCGVGAGILQEVAQFGWVYYMLYGQQPLGIGEAFSVMHRPHHRGSLGGALRTAAGLWNDVSQRENVHYPHPCPHQSQVDGHWFHCR